MSIEAMKQALEAWDKWDGGTLDHSLSPVMEALRQAIERAEQQERIFDCPRCGHCCPATAEQSVEWLTGCPECGMDGECGCKPEQAQPVWDASAPLVIHPHPAFQNAPPQMQPCAGRNCGSTDPNLHSAECFEDYEKATGMATGPVGEVLNERGEVDWISFVPPAGASLYTAPPPRQSADNESDNG